MPRRNPMIAKMSEAELQAAIVEYVQRNGWFCFFLPDWLYRLAIKSMQRARRSDRQWSPPGFPDLVMVQGLSDPRVPVRLVFMELKSQKGVVRHKQQQWLKALRRVSGIEVYVMRPSDWLDGTIDRIVEHGRMDDHSGTIKELERVIHEPKERE